MLLLNYDGEDPYLRRIIILRNDQWVYMINIDRHLTIFMLGFLEIRIIGMNIFLFYKNTKP